MGSRFLALLGLCLWTLGPAPVHGQAESRAPSAESPPRFQVPLPGAGSPSTSLQVFLVTLGEGQYYWEKFGHNALWFRDPIRGIDLAFNWGTFDFDAPDFLQRVLIGDSKYWVDTIASGPFFDFYRYHDRSIALQRLNLTPEQAQRALEFSLWNAREENKFYPYDYFRDNCSTRVRDVIDLALGGALKQLTGDAPTALTYRREAVRLVDDMKITQFGIDAALGRPSDRPLSVWESMFIPSRMQQALRELTVPGPNNSMIPVVAEERLIYESRSHQERGDVPSIWLPYLIIGLLIGAEVVVVAWIGERSRAADVIFRAEAALWALVTGIAGLVILLAWLITRHVFWYNNENLLLFNPLSLFAALLLLLSFVRPRWLRPATIIAVIAAALSALALVLKGLPGAQDNLPLVFLLLPAHFAIAYGLWRRARPTRPAATA